MLSDNDLVCAVFAVLVIPLCILIGYVAYLDHRHLR